VGARGHGVAARRSAYRESRWAKKPQKTATGMRTSSSRHPKNWKPTPGSDFVSRPYMLMNLGQRDEPYHTVCMHYIYINKST